MTGIDAVDAVRSPNETILVGIDAPEQGKADALRTQLQGFLEGLFEPHEYNGNSIELKSWEKEQKLNAYTQWIGEKQQAQCVFTDTDVYPGITSVERGKSRYTVSHNILGLSGSGKDESEARGNLSKVVSKHLSLVKKFFDTVPDAKIEFDRMIKTVIDARYAKLEQSMQMDIPA